MDEQMVKKISLSIRKRLDELLSAQTYFPAPDIQRHEYFSTQYMNDYGLRYLDLFLKRRRRNETSDLVDRLVMAMGNKNLLEKAPKFYTEIFRWSSHDDFEDFVKERLFKSCFVIELFRKHAMKERRDTDDPIFNTPQNLHGVQRHLISFDYQFPFCILVEFFKVTKDQDDPLDNLIDLALHFFRNMVGHPLKASDNLRIQIHEIKHLVNLVHDALCPLPLREISITVEMELELQFINYATELQEAGVKFKKMEGNNLDIKFEKGGKLEIPPLKVAENTLYLLQNLMEYEMQLPHSAKRYVHDYVKFIQCLINSPKDVELLRRGGIIENWLGNDQLISHQLFDLGNNYQISSNFTYSGIFKKVNDHCRHRRHVWMAKLWRNYFNSPWSFISFFAAVVLLLLTVTQTVFSILSYHH